MLSGIYFPDEGEIYVDGKEVTIASPKDSFALGIGMIHQHFKLVDVLTAAENIILGLPGKEVLTVEIIKVLYRGANILILDEPTAVLTPQETEKLFAVLRNMRLDGRSIIIITHKLHEVLSLSDRVAILRKGKYIGTVETKDATSESLTEMMVGQKVNLDIKRSAPKDLTRRLLVQDLTCVNPENVTTLNHATFSAYAVSYTHLRAHETLSDLVCRLLLEKIFFFNDTATTEIYTRLVVGSVRCV